MGDSRVRYARNGEVRLAYRVFGDAGPVAIWTPGWVVNDVDNIEEPDSPYARLVNRFAESMQLVIWDRRGTGLSDPADHVLTVEERVTDLVAVVDAVGEERPSLTGTGDGGALAIMFAAMYPDRIHRLLLYGAAARFSQQLPDHPWGFTADEIAAQLDEIDQSWGDGALVDLFHNEAAEIAGVREAFGKRQRSIASPTMAKLWWQAFVDVDVRGLLPTIQAPTLVLARPGDRLVPIEATKAMASAIPHARFEQLTPGPHNSFDIIDDLTDRVLAFLYGETGSPADERVVKTVMFTDIVGSTEKLSARGDAQWRNQLDAHDELVERVLSRYGGTRASHTGDGYFALLDGPTKAARCALELVPELATRGIPIRVGIHTGECERRGTEWSGLAVHTGARIGAMAGAGEILASRTVRDLSAGSGLVFESLGLHHLKGLPETIEVYRVRGR
ncbi:adenylate/guanylate cyclase domain-containing protein [Mycolicibacterium sp. CR10]|uniref:adenylate/guanylate cyclase domain-containing protein n=1 Tax=Mycolicibacterium sp. CR10 TaxID=2562314 RepID=UPI0010C0B13B|nr:adenylate/guanylate cyclase domain-containing protein [Mycolicibacterium sp. CR10]